MVGVLLLAALSGVGSAHAAAPQVSDVCDQNVAPGHYRCFAERLVTPTTERATAGSVPSGYGPGDLSSAYGLSTAPSGAGKRIYIIAAFDDPHAAADLARYRSTFGLPACTVANGCFRKVNQKGLTSPLPAANTGWAGEMSLDLDMASASCPYCGITLVEANDDSANLFVATRTATRLGARYVSMSWGGKDSSSDRAIDSTYLHSSGVVYSVATGDNGYSAGVTYPSTSPYALAVGGTTLQRSSADPRGWTESAWSHGQSGCSTDESQPTFQASVSTSCSGRAISDVSAIADPQTGVAVYDSYGAPGWQVYGGTSAAAPLIAGITARAGVNSQPAAIAYTRQAQFNDVTSGSNDTLCLGSVLCSAGTGWDGPTGVGTPTGVGSFGGSTKAQCTGNKLSNPGFESGAAGWSVAGPLVRRSATQAHTGVRYVRLDGTGQARTDRLARAITIPQGCRATLSYFLHVTSADHSRVAHDLLTLRINGVAVSRRSNLNQSAGYLRLTVNLNAYAGSKVTFAWFGKEGSGLATAFNLDDIRLTLTS
jgi:hypothetical protein